MTLLSKKTKEEARAEAIEAAERITIPALTVKKAHRVLLSPVRMPAELVAQAYTIMNRENWTPTEFTEKAWRLLIDAATDDPESVRAPEKKPARARNK